MFARRLLGLLPLALACALARPALAQPSKSQPRQEVETRVVARVGQVSRVVVRNATFDSAAGRWIVAVEVASNVEVDLHATLRSGEAPVQVAVAGARARPLGAGSLILLPGVRGVVSLVLEVRGTGATLAAGSSIPIELALTLPAPTMGAD